MQSHTRHLHAADALGLARLSIGATLGVTDLVEELHQAILVTPGLGDRSRSRTSGITGMVYRSIRGVTRLVGGSLDVALGLAATRAVGGGSSPERDALLAALNGVVGDHLAETNNPLAIPMTFRREGRSLTLERGSVAALIPAPSSRLVVMVHGLCLSDRSWERSVATAADTPQGGLAGLLARELGLTPVCLHYNSGRHISTNGHELAGLLEQLVAVWPVPIEELVIVAHSMGGLLVRSACHQATLEGQQWVRSLRRVVFLGTPHHGAPLEQGGHQIDRLLGLSRFSAPFLRLGRVRSAGITDLRHGTLLDRDWQGGDRFAAGSLKPSPVPLPEGCRSLAIAGTFGRRTGIADQIFGDGLVPLSSALGRHDDPARALAVDTSWVAEGVGHLELLDHPAVQTQIVRFLAEPCSENGTRDQAPGTRDPERRPADGADFHSPGCTTEGCMGNC